MEKKAVIGEGKKSAMKTLNYQRAKIIPLWKQPFLSWDVPAENKNNEWINNYY